MRSRLLKSHVADFIRKTHAAGLTKFRSFCAFNGVCSVPTQHATVVNFLDDLYSKGVSLGTARVCVSALQMNTSKTGMLTQSPHRSDQCYGACRVYEDQQKVRNCQLHCRSCDTKTASRSAPLNPSDRVMTWGAYTFAYFGSFRISELCCATKHATFPSALCLNSLCLTASPSSQSA